MKVLKAPQSGSQAGTTASHNRFGQYERNRRSPVQPIGGGRRAIVRANFGTASSGWAGLTTGDQGAWTAYADAHPITDSLGQSVKLTGHMMYVSITASRLNLGLGASVSPPASAVVGAITAVSATMTVDPIVGVQFTFSDAAGFVLIGASKQVSNGVTFQKTFAQISDDNGLGSIEDIANQYVTYLGAPSLGGKIFLRLTPVNQYGVTGTPTIIGATVGAASAIAAMVATSASSGTITGTWTGGTTRTIQAQSSMDGGTSWFAAAAVQTGVSPQTITGLASGSFSRLVSTVGGVVAPKSNSITIT